METADPFPLAIIVIAKIAVKNFDFYTSIGIIVSLILLIFSALISGAETAFFSLKSDKLKEIEKNNNFRNKLIIKLLKTPKKLLATFTIANSFMNVCFIITMGVLLNWTFDFTKFPAIAFIIQIAIIGFFIILFGEFLPKLYAKNKPEKFASLSSILIVLFYKLLHPFSLIMVNTSSVIGKKLAQIKQNVTIEDLSEALNLTEHQITEEENILKGIIKFGNINAKEIMKSRIDVIAIDFESKFKELLDFIIKSGHSRIPVYSETFDNIKGILYIKDLLSHIDKTDEFNWQSLIRHPYFVPENKKINDLLKEFQENKIHMAIVIDEYGGTSGIVTLEDVIEEIVGEITDESDEEELTYTQIDKNNYLFEGKTLLNDFLKIVDIEDDLFEDLTGDADTIAGVILELTGEIPDKNTQIDYKNITFTIEAVDKRRIKQIKVTIKD